MLGALSSHSARSVLVGPLFEKFILFLNMSCVLLELRFIPFVVFYILYVLRICYNFLSICPTYLLLQLFALHHIYSVVLEFILWGFCGF